MDGQSGDHTGHRTWSGDSSDQGKPSAEMLRSETSDSSRCTSLSSSCGDLATQKEMRQSLKESMQAYANKMREIMEGRMSHQSHMQSHEKSPTRSIGRKWLTGGWTQQQSSKTGIIPNDDCVPTAAASPLKEIGGSHCRTAATSTPTDLSPDTEIARDSVCSRKWFDPRVGMPTHRKVVFNSGPSSRSAHKIPLFNPRIDTVSPQEQNGYTSKRDAKLTLAQMLIDSEKDLDDTSAQILNLRLQSPDETSSVSDIETSERNVGWNSFTEEDPPSLTRNLFSRFPGIHKRKKWQVMIERDSQLVKDNTKDTKKDGEDVSGDDDVESPNTEESILIAAFPETEDSLQISSMFGSVEEGLDPLGFQCQSRVQGALGSGVRVSNIAQRGAKRRFDPEVQKRRAKRWAVRRSLNRPKFKIGNTTFKYSVAVALALSRLGSPSKQGKIPSWSIILPGLDLYELRRTILLRARMADTPRLPREKCLSTPSISSEPILAAIERVANGPVDDLKSVLRKRDRESHQVKKMVQFLLPDIVPSKS